MNHTELLADLERETLEHDNGTLALHVLHFRHTDGVHDETWSVVHLELCKVMLGLVTRAVEQGLERPDDHMRTSMALSELRTLCTLTLGVADHWGETVPVSD